MEQKNWCDFFKDIEANPKAIISGLTIGDLSLAREHLKECRDCYDRTERVLNNAPPDDTIIMGLN
jgi:hypothetical protein